MNHAAEIHRSTTEQVTKVNPAVEQNSHAQVATKNTLLNLTGYLTLAAIILPLVFTAAVFLGVASVGNLGDSITKVVLG